MEQQLVQHVLSDRGEDLKVEQLHGAACSER